MPRRDIVFCVQCVPSVPEVIVENGLVGDAAFARLLERDVPSAQRSRTVRVARAPKDADDGCARVSGPPKVDARAQQHCAKHFALGSEDEHPAVEGVCALACSGGDRRDRVVCDWQGQERVQVAYDDNIQIEKSQPFVPSKTPQMQFHDHRPGKEGACVRVQTSAYRHRRIARAMVQELGRRHHVGIADERLQGFYGATRQRCRSMGYDGNGHADPTDDRRSRMHLSCGSKEAPSSMVTNDVAGAHIIFFVLF